MSIGTWNVRGLCQNQKKSEIKRIIKQQNLELFGLIETKVRPVNFQHQCRSFGSNIRVISNGEEEEKHKPDTIWMCWDHRIWEVEAIKTQLQYIHCKAKNKGGLEIDITVVYGSSNPRKRTELWEEIRSLSSRTTNPWIVLGDFNEIRYSEERIGPKARISPKNLELFNKCIEDSSLIELLTIGDGISWHNMRSGEEMIASKLDRGFANEKWLDRWPNTKYRLYKGGTSDHALLIIDIRKLKKQTKPFRFTNSWIHESDLRNIVRGAWRKKVKPSSPLLEFTWKLRNVKTDIKKWVRNKPRLEKELSITHKLLEQTKIELLNDPQSHTKQEEVKRISHITKQLEQNLEENLRQRSRAYWLRLGDQNTKFFGNMIRERKNTNTIYRLINNEGNPTITRKEMVTNCLAYFGDLFKENSTQLNRSPRTYQNTVSEEENLELNRTPTKEEIQKVVNHLNPDKSPGPDGFNGAFFREFWDIIGNDLVQAIKSIFEGNLIPSQVNATFVTLIPKVSNASTLAQFRPISCINTTYKIISKIMTNRMVPIIQRLISSNQTAFLPGRLIGDNFLLATEMIAGFGRQAGGAKAAIKVDLAKAFDTCNWLAMEETLREFQFSENWIRLTMMCVCTTKLSFLVDGVPTTPIKPGRGLRQGDPLSPYLFTLLMQNFSSLINEKENRQELKPFKQSRVKGITHLMYADDLLVFCKAKRNCLTAVKELFKQFSANTGLCINNHKSTVHFSEATQNKEELLGILGYNQGKFPIKYLGLPLSPRILTERDCSPMIASMAAMTADWKKKLLSHAGRVQLFHWGIMGVFNFWNQSCRIPKGVLTSITSLAYNYIWAGKRDFSWEDMTLPKEEGGLGLRDFRTLALAATMKRVHRLWTCDISIWAKWMRDRYIRGIRLYEITKRPNADSALWAGVLDDRTQFINYMTCNNNYEFNWKGFGNNFSFKNAVETVRNKKEKDNLAKGIWCSKIGKHSMTLWRARWGRITTKYEAARRLRSQLEDTDCILCNGPLESQTHLFYRCEYARDLWLELRRWKPGLFSDDNITLEDYMEQAERRTKGGPCWGFSWTLIGAATWTIWTERNKRLHEDRHTTASEQARRIKADIGLVFQPGRYKRKDTTRERQILQEN